jgi:hypothetical protein
MFSVTYGRSVVFVGYWGFFPIKLIATISLTYCFEVALNTIEPKVSMCCMQEKFNRDSEFTYFYDFSIECWNCSDSVIYIFSFYYRLWKKPSWVAIVKKIWLWSSSVIKIVKMKYNWIDIKWRLASTSFKIYLDILSNFYITFTICYYNTINIFPQVYIFFLF